MKAINYIYSYFYPKENKTNEWQEPSLQSMGDDWSVRFGFY